jgi:hypothetical protein
VAGEDRQNRPCPTCSRPWSEDAFYAGCAECKVCKRSRSKRNRAAQARRLAAFDRFVEVVMRDNVQALRRILADHGGDVELAQADVRQQVTRAIESLTARQGEHA